MPLCIKILIGLSIVVATVGGLVYLFLPRRERGMLGSEILTALAQEGWVLQGSDKANVLLNTRLKMRITRGSWTNGDKSGDRIRFMQDDADGQSRRVYEIHCPVGEVPDTELEAEILAQLRQWKFV